MIETTTPVLSEFLGSVGTFFGEAIEWLSAIINTIAANPVLMVLCLAMPICGFAVGLLGRLIRL